MWPVGGFGEAFPRHHGPLRFQTEILGFSDKGRRRVAVDMVSVEW